VARSRAGEHGDGRRAVGERGGEGLGPELRHLVDRERQRAGGQARAETARGLHQLRAMLAVVEDHDRVAAAGGGIGPQERAEPGEEVLHRRQRVMRRAGRAGGGALAAARADHRVDRHGVARRRDRAGGAEVEAAGAAGDAVARMGAEPGVVLDIARLVEGADEMGGVHHRPRHRRRMGGIGTEVARAQLVAREERPGAAQVEDDVGLRGRAIGRRAEVETRARRRRGMGEGVDVSVKAPRWPGSRADAALQDREVRAARRHHVRAGLEEHRDVEMLGEAPRRLERVSSRPRMRTTPSDSMLTRRMGGAGSDAAASSAAIFGPEVRASSVQPAVSRMLA
jgi:hypothetical protein